ncbi:MAG: hypothetical protein WA160_14050 [Pseudobdellovibrio sp.]
MKKIITILSLMSMSLAVHAKMLSETEQLAAQVVAEFKAEKNDRAESRANAKDYYDRKLSLCLFEQDLENSLNKSKKTIDLKSCTYVISQALSRGDLTESGVREVIDSLSARRNTADSENEVRIERQKQIQLRANELVDYGNQKLN